MIESGTHAVHGHLSQYNATPWRAGTTDRLRVRGAKDWGIAKQVYCGLFVWKRTESRKFPAQAISYYLVATKYHLRGVRRDNSILSRIIIFADERSSTCFNSM